jgi:hypothetical protein
LQLLRGFILQACFVMILQKFVAQAIAESDVRVLTHRFVVLQRCVVGCWTIQQDNKLEDSGRRLSQV